MDRILPALSSPQMKSRMTAVDDLQTYLETNEVADRDEAAQISAALESLLKDNNAKVCEGALCAARNAVEGAPELFERHVPSFIGGVFDRLGDLKAPVREAGQRLLVTLMANGVSEPATLVGGRSSAWKHKNWRVREGLLRTIESAFDDIASEGHDMNGLDAKTTLPQCVAALEDREAPVREAAADAVCAMGNATGGGDVVRALNKFTIRPAQLKDIQTRLGVDAGPSAAVSAAAAGSSSRPSSHSGVRSGATSSSSSPPATSHASRGHYGGDDRRGHGAPPPASSRPGAGSSRPSTTGGMLRRANSGGIPPADASAAPPPYGAATGSVPRIAEGAPPRPVHVDSERELSQEMEKIATRLNPAKEWTDRIAAMVRIEALLLGGAAEWENFPAILSRLREPLTHQAADRRSAIVRQVAHLLVVLAAELGGEFEKEATHYVPELFKCVVITVQIIAESGDLGVRGVLHNCHAKHLIPKICDAASKDRSAKLRSIATGWLSLVVKEWDLGERSRDVVEDAVLNMVGDGNAEVRVGARRMFLDYARRFPDAASRAHARMDANTQRLIAQESAAGYDGDEYAKTGVLDHRPGRVAGRVRSTSRPATTAATARVRPAPSSSSLGFADGYGGADSYLSAPDVMDGKTRGSAGGGGGGGGVGRDERRRSTATGGARHPSSSSAAAAAAEKKSSAQQQQQQQQQRDRDGDAYDGSRYASDGHLRPAAGREREPSSVLDVLQSARALSPRAASSSISSGGGFGASSSIAGPSSSSSSAAVAWESKVAVFDALARAIRVGGVKAAADATTHVDKLSNLFVRHLSDPHHRVALSALEAFVEVVPACGGALEPYLERLCPSLFPRLVDAKESVRGVASAALAAVGDAHSADALLPALLTSLESAKAPRAKTGVLEFALYVLSGQGGGTDPTGIGKSPASAGSGALSEWVARVAPLTSDRHAPLRAAAAAGLAAVHARADARVLLWHLASLSSADAAAVCRAVSPHAPSVDSEFHAYVSGGGAESAHRSRRASSGAARRRSSSGRYGAPSSDSDDDVDAPPGPARRTPTRRDSAAGPADDVASRALRASMERLGLSSPTRARDDLDGAAGLRAHAASPGADWGPASAAKTTRADDALVGAGSADADYALAEALSLSARDPSRALPGIRAALRDGASPGANAAGQVLAIAFEALAPGAREGTSSQTRSCALFALRDLAEASPRAFAPHAAVAVPRIVDHLRGDDAQTAMDAADALDGVCAACAPADALKFLAPHLGDGGAAPVRSLCAVVSRTTPDELMRRTPDVIPGLVEAFNSPSADVRKAVVDALVAAYDGLGDWLLPQLGALTPAQQKLVTIYINRAMEKNGGAGAKRVGADGRVPLAPRMN